MALFQLFQDKEAKKLWLENLHQKIDGFTQTRQTTYDNTTVSFLFLYHQIWKATHFPPDFASNQGFGGWHWGWSPWIHATP